MQDVAKTFQLCCKAGMHVYASFMFECVVHAIHTTTCTYAYSHLHTPLHIGTRIVCVPTYFITHTHTYILAPPHTCIYIHLHTCTVAHLNPHTETHINA